MRNIFITSIFMIYATCLMGQVAINDINFPDANFRTIVTGSAIDTTDDDVLSDSEIQAVASLDVNGSSISDLKGIEYFTALTYLDCRNNRLTSLDVSNSTALTQLYCNDNQLPSLDVSKNTALTTLWCYSNKLTSLDVSKNTALTTLFCHHNQLKSLDVSKNTALTGLQCYNNLLTSLNVANGNNNILTGLVDFRFNSDLTCIQTDTGAGLSNWQRDNGASYSIDCRYINEANFPDANFRAIVTGSAIDTTDDDLLSDSEIQAVTNLDVSSKNISDLKGIEYFTALTILNCFSNQLPSLDVSKNTALTRLECYANSLTSLDVSKNTALTRLNCRTNQLTGLDVSKNTALTRLDCYTNSLTSLDVSKNTALTYLSCHTNQLTSLDLKNGLNNILTTFNATSNTNLTCIQADATTVPSGANWTKDAGASYSTRCLYINDINFPDANFRAIVTGSAIDTTDDDVLSDSEIQAVTSLDVSGETISDLTGIEHFTALTILNCFSNQLPSLDVSKNTALTRLECYANQLTSLDVSNNTALTILYCYGNQLPSLDTSNNTALTRLDCYANQLTSLDVSKNTALTRLECYANSLTSLDVSKNTALTRLDCYTNSLTSLDVSKNTALTYLSCSTNQLPSLDVSSNTALTYLSCHTNQLTSLDVSKNTALTNLFCFTNQLTGLDVSKNTALTRLECYANQLPSLDVSKNTALTYLSCHTNQLTSLDLKNGLNNILTTFNATSNTNLTCIQVDATTVPSGANWTKDAGASYSTRCLYINDINFPDANFRAIVTGSAIDTTDDDVLSDSEIQAVARLAVSSKNISDLKGIEYFTALTYLDCRNNRLTSLDVSNNTALTQLYCYSNQLPSLDTSNNTALTILWCYSNQLPSLDTSNNTALTSLWCFSNRLTSLDVSKNTALTTLFCHHNQLKSLDVSKNTALTGLQCYNNLLTSLNVANGNNNILTGLVDFRFNSDLTCIQTDTGAGLSTWTKDAGASYSTRCLYINDINFPDANFRAIVTGSAIDTTDDDVLSDSEIQAVTNLDVSSKNISDLKGIEYFTALTSLSCYTNQLTSLDVSKNTALTRLECYANSLTSLDVSKNTALTRLDCYTNSLTSLDVSKNTALTRLDCYTNSLTSLDVSKNTALTTLLCYSNQLSSLDVSKNTALTRLNCSTNQLTGLDVSKNTALTYLSCHTNQLTSLDLKNGLNNILTTFNATSNTNLTCIQVDATTVPSGANWTKDAGASYSTRCLYINDINFPDANFRAIVTGSAIDTTDDDVLSDSEIQAVTNLDVSSQSISNLKGIEHFTALTRLNCYTNSLTSLDVSKNTALTRLECYDNQLTSLDVSKNTALTRLNCRTNQLTGLDVSKNTALTTLDCYTNSLTSLDVSKNTALTTLLCYSNQLSSLDVSKNTALTSLNCRTNQLTGLDVSKNTALTTLFCHHNQLKSLDVSKNTALTYLSCHTNQLTSLDLKNGLNNILTRFNATSNTNLTCIQADATTVPSGANWTKDAGASYSTDCSGIVINSINFPDANFRAIVGGSTIDKNNNGVLSDSEIQAVTNLDVSSQSISNLKGIEHFTALTILNCFSNQLPSLDVSKNTALTRLECYANQLTSLDVSNNTALTILYCYSNQLTGLDVSKNTALTYLSCHTNQLTSLDLKNGLNNILTTFNATSNTNLTCIQADATTVPSGANWTKDAGASYSTDCSGIVINSINFPDANFRAIVGGSTIDKNNNGVLSDSEIQAVTNLDVSSQSISNLKGIEHFTALTILNCFSNQLPSLDVSKNTALTRLECYANQLPSLDVSNNTALTILYCYSNQLTGLDVSKNTDLTRLDCYTNSLTSLDVSKNTALTRLDCYANSLTSLDVSKNTALKESRCNNNQLTGLDVSKNTALTRLDCYINSLTSLDVSKNTALTRLNCRNNQLTGLDVSKNTALTYLNCRINQLTSLNVKNGQNTILTTFNATSNTNLTCIQADATTVPSGANWTKDAGASYSTSCVYWTGATDTDWATATNWDGGVPTAQSYVTIQGASSKPVISSGTNATAGDITINSVASLTINGGALDIKNKAVGNITYNRNLGTTNWYLVSSPVTGETYDDAYVTANTIAVSGDNRGIATYNTSSDTWSYMQGGGSGAFTSGKGYSVKRASAGDISFMGTLNNSDVSLTVDNTGNGFNLVGNPYATHINSNPFLTSNAAKLVTETIWVWDQEDEVYDARVSIMDFKLAPTQGFFVQAKATATGDLDFDYSAIKSTGGTFQKTDLSQIKLSITDGASKRQARVLYYDAATKGFDNGGDGEVFTGNGANTKFDVYTHLLKDDKGKKYQVQSLPKAEIESMIIPVGVKSEADKEITFSIEKLNIPSSVEVILEDRTEGTFTKLDNGNNYKVLTSASDDIGRFYLHTTQAALNILDNRTLSEVNVYKTDNDKLRVVGLPTGNATVRIYNILGKEIINNSFSSTGVKDISLPNLSSGIYIISIETETGKLVRKISF